MTEHPLPQEIIHWLDAATDGLPVQRAKDIRMELLAHYEDAVEDYLLLGKTDAESQQQAQIDLGDCAAVNREFNNLYYGRRRSFTALFCTFASLWLGIGLGSIIRGLGIEDLTTAGRLIYASGHVINLAMIVYVLLILKQLLNWQFNLSILDQPIRFIIGCAIVGLFGSTVLELIMSSWDEVPTVFNVATAPEAFFVLIRDLAYFALGLGVYWMANCLLKTRTNIYGLGKILTIGARLMAVGIWGSLVTAYLDNLTGLMISHLVLIFGHLVTWPTLAMLFFRAAYRAPVIGFRNA